jgi:hypothetical protein
MDICDFYVMVCRKTQMNKQIYTTLIINMFNPLPFIFLLNKVFVNRVAHTAAV